MIGKEISHYTITSLLGKGGMGDVYQAKDTKLGRDVAIKVLPVEFAIDASRVDRFRREAKALAALNHPNITTIYDINNSEGVEFIVMEYVEGCTLNQLIGSQGLPIEQVLNYAAQITSALGAAHETGIIHRDLKPANIMVTDNGTVKVLDFGLSRLMQRTDGSAHAATQTTPDLTLQGVILGTAAYMSPEQAEGKPVDARSDIFSFGSVLFEMLTGQRAFRGESYISTLGAILRDTPVQVRKLRKDAPAPLEQIVNRCLEKNRETRYKTGADVWKELSSVQSQLAMRRVGFGQILRRPQFSIPVLTLLVVIAVMIGWYWMQSSRVHHARTVVLPEITRLVDASQSCAAFLLMKQVERYLKGDPEFERLWQNATVRRSIYTDPPGADFYMRDYVSDNPEWMYVGRTPLESVTVPFNFDDTRLVYRVTKPGFDEKEGSFYSSRSDLILAPLIAKGSGLPGMILVPDRPAGISFSVIQTTAMRDVGLQKYWLDKYEVTNRQFKEFMDQGGYEKKEYWKYPFMNEGKALSFEEVMTRFMDTTGRQGPGTWEYGTYPQGRADYPVGGVSWYEAAAYAEFSGKSLPTIHHWAAAMGYEGGTMPILHESNFFGKGTAPVGSYRGLGPYGTYDMAGNVREWCFNASENNRYILGGAWNSPSYMLYIPDLSPLMDRSPANGFRCAKYTSPLPDELTGAVQLISRDRRRDKPVSNDIFQIYKKLHEYDHGDLKSRIEASDDSPPYWRIEKVSFQAAYGNERVTAFLYLPKNTAPPYQAVVFMDGINTMYAGSSENISSSLFDFIIRSGRAVMYPIYKGTYERSFDGALEAFFSNTNRTRDMTLDIAKDLGRSLDYLKTRQDIDKEKLAYQGYSWGACEGPRLVTLEPRIKAGILMSGGAYGREYPAEVDPFNFAPHTRTPILMVNGKYDYAFPIDGSLIPLFEALGTPEKDKRYVLLEAGHGIINQEVIRLSLEWLDRYLGPVRTR
jgi:eukaryotic-like serine/threonine-protein kinase